MKNLRFTFIIAIAIFASFIISACNSAVETDTAKVETEKKIEKTDAKKGMEVGESAPSFEVTTVDGTKVSDEALKGNPAVLVFWSVYCSKCKKETPQINQLAKEFSPKGVEVIGINIGESDAEIKKGIESFGIDFAVAPDQDKNVMQKFGAVGTPTIVFLDKDGKVQFYGNKLPENYSERLNSLS